MHFLTVNNNIVFANTVRYCMTCLLMFFSSVTTLYINTTIKIDFFSTKKTQCLMEQSPSAVFSDTRSRGEKINGFFQELRVLPEIIWTLATACLLPP